MTSATTDQRRSAGSSFTLYAVLGLEPGAAPDEIRAAYRRLAREFHPDAGGDARYMRAINKAWAELGDPERRDAYDRRMGIDRTVRVSPAPAVDESMPLTSMIQTRTSGGTTLDFGRYEGWTIGELARHDPDYLLWLERTPTGRHLQAEIRAALEAIEARR